MNTFREQNKKTIINLNIHSKLQSRAALLEKIRQFFKTRHVLEVETPLLYPSTIPSPHIESFTSQYIAISEQIEKTLYLQTSPEFAMKRLLAQGSRDIYQICKAWRNGEQGKQHNPEFTILEWYRIGYDHHKLMDEMDELLQFILGTNKAERYSYTELFLDYLHIDPLLCSVNDLQQCAINNSINITMNTDDKDTWLQLLLTHLIEPHLGQNNLPTFVYDFPPTQAALAKIRKNKGAPDVAERFEVYVKGIELANGFHELNDPVEQRQRFMAELELRQQLNLLCPPLDEDLLADLDKMPACAGVALGIDRLLMLLTNVNTIQEVLSFSF